MNRPQPRSTALPDLIDRARKYFEQQLFDDAATLFLQALELAPDNPDLCFAAGNALRHTGRFGHAAELYQRAIDKRSDFVAAYCNLGGTQFELHRFDEAIAAYRTASLLQPESTEICLHLAGLYLRQSRIAEAETILAAALERQPGSTEAAIGLGNIAMMRRDLAAAKEHFLKALRIRPDAADAHHQLGDIMREWDRLDEAAACYANAEKFHPGREATLVNLGITRQLLGETTISETCFRQVLAINPSNAAASHNLLVSINYNAHHTAENAGDPLRRWGAAATGTPTPDIAFDNDRQPGRRLKIGFLSPDFCNHPAAAFLDPMLRFRNSQEYETLVYAETIHDDERTADFRELADHWTPVEQLTDRQLADQIRSDRIDLLIDTAGHLNGNRLGVFARRTAPLQISGIGYPGGTGLATMDYRISDRIIDPEEDTATAFEIPLRLEHGFCCYRPYGPMPPVNSLPARNNGCITFGALHTTARLNENVIARWSRALRSVPASRMIICRSTLAPSVIKRLSGWFADNGITPDRIDFRTNIPSDGHLTVYNDIDVSFDTLPWSGHTTACESLIMGVPVITCLGDRPAGRMVSSLLTMAGLPEFIARSDEEFAAIAAKTASTCDELALLRSQLRARILASALCNGPAYMNGLEAAFRTIWRKWCTDK